MKFFSTLFMFVCLQVILLPRGVTADIHRTAEANAVHQLAIAIRVYAQEHDGHVPTKWDQLKGIIDLEKINRSLQQRLQDMYIFVGDGKEMPKPELGRVIVIRKRAFRDRDRDEPGGYVVWRKPDGSILDGWLAQAELEERMPAVDEFKKAAE